MPLSRRTFLAAVPLGALVAALRGQTAEPAPEDIAVQGYEMVQQGTFTKLLRQLDPAVLSGFQHAWQQLLNAAGPMERRSALSLLDLETMAEFDALSAAELLARALQQLSERMGDLSEFRLQTLGTLRPSDDEAIVVYRLATAEGFHMPPRVLCLRRVEGKWLLLMTGELTFHGSPQQLSISTKLPEFEVEVLGRIGRGSDAVLVVYASSTKTDVVTMRQVSVSEIKRSQTDWWGHLQKTDEQLAAAIEQGVRSSVQSALTSAGVGLEAQRGAGDPGN